MKFVKFMQSAFNGGRAKNVDNNEVLDHAISKNAQITSNINSNLANNYWQR